MHINYRFTNGMVRYVTYVAIHILHTYLAMATYVCPYVKYHLHISDVFTCIATYVHHACIHANKLTYATHIYNCNHCSFSEVSYDLQKRKSVKGPRIT